MLHLGRAPTAARRARRRPRGDAGRVDQPELAAARARSTRRAASPPRDGRELLAETIAALAARAPGDPRAARASTCSTSASPGGPGVHGYDPLRLAVDVRGTGATGYEVARLLREQRRHQPRARRRERRRGGVRHGGDGATDSAARLVAALAHAVERARRRRGRAPSATFAPPPPWGPLEMTPREAFLGAAGGGAGRAGGGPHRGRVARRLPARASRTCCPASGSPRRRWTTSRRSLAHGGSLRGASDRTLRTARVVVEAG